MPDIFRPETKLPADPLEIRRIIYAVEAKLMELPQVQSVFEPVHRRADGLYAREIFIPKGTMLTGKIHKRQHMNMIVKGDITVLTEDGVKRIQAPAIIVSEPGTKRLGWAHEDTVWITLHATAETEIDAIEADLVCNNHDEWEAQCRSQLPQPS